MNIESNVMNTSPEYVRNESPLVTGAGNQSIYIWSRGWCRVGETGPSRSPSQHRQEFPA